MTDMKLNQFIASGTNAERLAFTPDPATPASGPDPSYIWHETDTGDTYAWDFDGAAWDKVNGATGLANAVTFDTTGGAAAGTTFDGSAAKTIDYSTVGAAAAAEGVPDGGTDGQVLTKQSGVDQDVDWETPGYPTFSGALVKKSADQTAANYSSGVVVPFDSEDYDTDSYHDTSSNNSRITIPANGKYVFAFGIEVSGGTLTASDYVRGGIIKGGSVATSVGLPFATTEISATTTAYLTGTSAAITCSATEFFEVWFDTESDTSITLTALGTWFSVRRVA